MLFRNKNYINVKDPCLVYAHKHIVSLSLSLSLSLSSTYLSNFPHEKDYRPRRASDSQFFSCSPWSIRGKLFATTDWVLHDLPPFHHPIHPLPFLTP